MWKCVVLFFFTCDGHSPQPSRCCLVKTLGSSSSGHNEKNISARILSDVDKSGCLVEQRHLLEKAHLIIKTPQKIFIRKEALVGMRTLNCMAVLWVPSV